MARAALQRGFTYVGLLVLVAVLGIVSAAAVGTGATLQRRSHENELLFIGSQFQAAFKSYYEATPAGQPRYPAKLEDLVRDARPPGIRRHLRKVFIDPLTGKDDWGTIQAPEGGIAGVFSRSPRKPIKVGGFPPEFAGFEKKERYSDWVFGFAPAPTPEREPNQEQAGARSADEISGLPTSAARQSRLPSKLSVAVLLFSEIR